MAFVRVVEEVVPITFLVGDLGYVVVSVSHLSICFLLSENLIYIDEEVYNNLSGELTHTIGQEPNLLSPSRQWHLQPGKYLAYGLPQSVVGASSREGTHRLSSTSTSQTPLPTRVKIEPGVVVIAINNDDSDDSSLPHKLFKSTLSPSTKLPTTSFIPSPTLETPSGSSNKSSIVHCVHKLCHTKGLRNSFVAA